MGLYEVISAPAVFVTDGQARIYGKPGGLLELTEDQAASFDPPDAIRQIGTEDREDLGTGSTASVPAGTPVTFLSDPPSTIVDDPEVPPAGGESPAEGATPEPTPEPKKVGDRRRQGKPETDGQD